MKTPLLAAVLACTSLASFSQVQTPADPYQWLEEVTGDKALAWVRERNAETEAVIKNQPGFGSLRTELLEGLNARDRIPRFTRMGDSVYNLWTDAKNKRGLWRRTSLAEYSKPDPAWETVLDLDALGAAEKESWVFNGASCLAPTYQRCMLQLSRGGADATVAREFDTRSKTFVNDGFTLPEAKSGVDWQDENHLLVGTDFGAGSMTDSGYARIVKLWTRGTPLSAAKTLFEGDKKDTYVFASAQGMGKAQTVIVQRALDFYRFDRFLVQTNGTLRKLALPADAQFQRWDQRLLVELRSDWKLGATTHKAGSLLVASWPDFLTGKATWRTLFTPTATRSLAGFTTTQSHVLLNVSDNVASKLEEWSFAGKGAPQRRDVKAPFPGNLSVSSLHDPELAQDSLADRYLVNYADFLTPDTLYLAQAGTDERLRLKSRQTWFDSTGMRVEQQFATSKDGTKVPYFVVYPKGATINGKNPTLLYGYGGFDVSMTPRYSSSWGRGWLQRGGVLVMSNIRGGGEFGPTWHKSAILQNKQRSYDDFIAIAEDLIKKGVTTPQQLGIMGGSNGGLLVGAVTVQRPDLFNAVVCQVPLLDMQRYHTLLAGASWMAEYGNPDKPEDWAFISKYSPYQNVKATQKMPRMLINTSTRDDRVHPGHARKMAARMIEQGHKPYYWENIEGGHGGAADNEQRATWQAIEYAYLWMQLGAK